MEVPNYSSCYLRRNLFTEHVSESHPFWNTVESDHFLLELRKIKRYTRLYSCRHGRRHEVLPFLEPAVVGFGIPEDSLATTPVDCIVDTLEDEDFELSEQEIEHIAGFMVEMRSRMSPGSRATAVAEIYICAVEHVTECVHDHILTDDSEAMDWEELSSESDLDGFFLADEISWWPDAAAADDPKKTLLASMRYEYKIGNGDDTCSICLAKFFEGDELAKTPCSHFFHQECLGTWLIRKTSCPLCRNEIESMAHSFI